MADRTALVTGCSSGIGRAFADELRRRGWRVYATARTDDDLAALADAGFDALRLDVTRAEDIDEVAHSIRDGAGRLDLLINNAGINAVGAVLDVDADTLRRQLEINVVGPISLVQACFDLLRASDDARVINVGSVVGVMATPFAGPYSASKAALHRLSDAMRMEMGPLGIKVIIVQPGAIRSAMGDNATANATIKDDSPYAALREQILGRARLSQEQDPTPADEFARTVLDDGLAADPPAVIRAGSNAWLLPTLRRWAPTRLADRLLSRRFKLERLAASEHDGTTRP